MSGVQTTPTLRRVIGELADKRESALFSVGVIGKSLFAGIRAGNAFTRVRAKFGGVWS
jgi:hypothetical protein